MLKCSSRYCFRARFIHCNAIVTRNKPKELEAIFKQIAHETINDIFNSSHQFLNQTLAKIDREIKQTQARLNELENDELRISRQISFAQESVEKSRNEGKYNFSQVLTLLRQMNELPILPEPLCSIAEQDLQPSDIRRLAPQFLGQVNYYQNRFDKLEFLIPKLNPFSILSNINNLIKDELNICKNNNKSLSQEIKNARHQLDKIDIKLEQNLENLKAQRARAKIVIEELLNQLAEQLKEQTRLEADIHRQILITKEQVETSKSEAELKIEQFIELWQEIRESSQLLPQLHIFFNKCFQNPKAGIAEGSELSLLVQTYESQIAQLENLIPQLNPFPVLSKIKSKIDVNLQQQQKTTAEAFNQLQDYQYQLDEIKAQLQKLIDAIKKQRYWWQEYWQIIPEQLKPEVEITDLFELNFLRRFKKLQFKVWQQQLGVTEAYLNRYQNLISDNEKLKLGLEYLSRAEKDVALLGPALVSLHGALEDHFRYWLSSNPSVPLSEREAFNFGRIQWRSLLDLMQQYGNLNEKQRKRILHMNELRNQGPGHGGQYTGTRSELEQYADFVLDIIVNSI